MAKKGFVRVDINTLCNSCLSIYEKLVFVTLQALAEMAGKDVCTASASYIAEQCGVSERQVRRCIRKPEDEGFIETITRRGEDGGTLSNAYTFRR